MVAKRNSQDRSAFKSSRQRRWKFWAKHDEINDLKSLQRTYIRYIERLKKSILLDRTIKAQELKDISFELNRSICSIYEMNSKIDAVIGIGHSFTIIRKHGTDF